MADTTSLTNLISLTGAFLTATGLFFAALGATATDNEPLKTFLSAAALLMSAIWIWAAILLTKNPFDGPQIELVLAIPLPAIFIIGWFISLSVHACRLKKRHLEMLCKASTCICKVILTSAFLLL